MTNIGIEKVDNFDNIEEIEKNVRENILGDIAKKPKTNKKKSDSLEAILDDVTFEYDETIVVEDTKEEKVGEVLVRWFARIGSDIIIVYKDNDMKNKRVLRRSDEYFLETFSKLYMPLEVFEKLEEFNK